MKITCGTSAVAVLRIHYRIGISFLYLLIASLCGALGNPEMTKMVSDLMKSQSFESPEPLVRLNLKAYF